MATNEIENIGQLFDLIRGNPHLRQISIDERQHKLYTLFQQSKKGAKGMNNFVAYFRVSTKGQGISGLGLDAQRGAVEAFVHGNGGKVLKEFTEVESGGKTSQDRPELAAALAYAKRAGAVLCVAKLDRLARNVSFLSGLMESGADFVACDNPHATRFTIHILAAVAEWEREAISNRTKAALAQSKARGVKLGSARPGHWEGREEARLKGLEKGRVKARRTISQKARVEYADLLPVIERLREEGLSFQKIAAVLNAEGHRTRRGAMFAPTQVRNILERK